LLADACWLWERGANGEKLFGQDQLVFTGDAQQVTLTGVLDFNGGVTTQNLLALQARSNGAAVGRCGGERGSLAGLPSLIQMQTRMGRIMCLLRIIVNNISPH
jgi:hypothetical protein